MKKIQQRILIALLVCLSISGCQEKSALVVKSAHETYQSFTQQLLQDTAAIKALRRQTDARHSLQLYFNSISANKRTTLLANNGLQEHFKLTETKRFQVLGFASRREEMLHILDYHDMLEKVIKFYKDNGLDMNDREMGLQALYRDVAEPSSQTSCELYCHYGNIACETSAENDRARNYQWCNMGRTNCCYDIGQPDECCFEQSCYASADMWYYLSLQSCFQSYSQCVSLCQDEDEYRSKK